MHSCHQHAFLLICLFLLICPVSEMLMLEHYHFSFCREMLDDKTTPPSQVYADPNTIPRKEHPATGDVYTMPDKARETHKPEDHLPTYQVEMSVVMWLPVWIISSRQQVVLELFPVYCCLYGKAVEGLESFSLEWCQRYKGIRKTSVKMYVYTYAFVF